MADSVLSQAGDILAQVAPTIASFFGGPMAGLAVSSLERVFGLTPAEGASDADRKMAAAQAVTGASMDQIIALKKEEDDFKSKLIDAGIRLEVIDAGDRADARKRQVDTKDLAPTVFAAGILLGFFGLLGAMAFRAWPEANATMLNMMVTVLGTLVVAISNYYFGSSAGSAAKTKLLAAAGLPDAP